MPYVLSTCVLMYMFVTDGVKTEANGAQLAEVSMCQSYNIWWAHQKWSEGMDLTFFFYGDIYMFAGQT